MRPGPVLLRVYEVLLDGEWHPLPQVLLEAGKVVPPGVAQRKIENQRVVRRRHGHEARARGGLTDDIRSGQRRLARELIHRALERGQLELDPPHKLTRRDWTSPSCRRVRLAERALKYAAEEVARASGSSAT